MRLRVALPLLLLLLVAAFVALAPASLVDARVATASGGRLRLADADGTLWRGSATLTDASGTWRLPLAWRASLRAALVGAADVEFVPPGRARGRVAANGGIATTDFHLTLPGAALAAVFPAAIAVTVGGELALDAPTFRFDGRGGDGALMLRWERARVVINGAPVDVGSVTARVAPRGADLAADLSSEGGALLIKGDATWSNGQVVANATLTPVGPLPPVVAQALAALGPADASGAVRVSWRGPLR